MKIYLLVFLMMTSTALSQELSVEATRNLDFGTVVQGQAAKSVDSKRNNPNNARFLVTGPARTRYSVILPVSASLLHFPAGNALTINAFELSPNNLRLSNQGTQEIIIGATLQAIPLNQRGGSYAGHFTIEVIIN